MIKPSGPARGIYAALVTPRKAGCVEPDAAALLDYLETVGKAGVDGFVLLGSTGEFIHYDLAERIRTVALAIKRAKVPVLVNVSHSNLDGTIDLAEHAVDAGAAGVLLLPPYFYRYSDEQIEAFYRAFADELKQQIPIYLYNLPQFGNAISPAVAERLFGSGDFAGIKDSSGDWQLFEALQALHTKHPFQLLLGSEAVYGRGRAGGADGAVSGIAAALPELLVAMDKALDAQDKARVELLHGRLMEFVHWVERFPATLAIRQAAVFRGWIEQSFAVPPDQTLRLELDDYRRWFQPWLDDVLRLCVAESASV